MPKRTQLPPEERIDYSVRMAVEYFISCCPPDQRADALRMLHAGLTADQQAGLVHALDAAGKEGESAFAGLLVATLSGKLQSVVWIQILPGKTAVVWPPKSGEPASLPLMQAASHFLAKHDLPLTQILIQSEAPVDQKLMEAGEFRKLVDLAYLLADRSFFPPTTPETELEFLPRASNDPKRLGKLLVRTYQGSLDCPALNGVRSKSDILEGYAAQGNYTPEHWFFIRSDGEDVGALILAEHGKGEQWELVYMGVVPEGRGQGVGWQIVQFALWQAQRGGAQRVILAVDETNSYAIEMYQRAGFISWDRRTVYARLQPSTC